MYPWEVTEIVNNIHYLIIHIPLIIMNNASTFLNVIASRCKHTSTKKVNSIPTPDHMVYATFKLYFSKHFGKLHIHHLAEKTFPDNPEVRVLSNVKKLSLIHI